MIQGIITILILGLCILGISIKIWSKNDGKFSGTCASQNPYLNHNGDTCGYRAKKVAETTNCENPH